MLSSSRLLDFLKVCGAPITVAGRRGRRAAVKGQEVLGGSIGAVRLTSNRPGAMVKVRGSKGEYSQETGKKESKRPLPPGYQLADFEAFIGLETNGSLPCRSPTCIQAAT
jgi:hypothetical protein